MVMVWMVRQPENGGLAIRGNGFGFAETCLLVLALPELVYLFWLR